MLYGAFQFGSLLGIQVFLPPLLIESFSSNSMNGTVDSMSSNITEVLDEMGASAIDAAQYKISLGLSLFGIGGIVGVFSIGFILSCAARFKYVVFVLNSVFLLVITLCYIFVVDSFVGIGILTTILGALHQAWFGIIW